jgi:anthranilate synthase component 2
MHGKSSKISLDYDFIFKSLPSEISVGRYHSLSLVEDSLPDCPEIISKARDDGEVMAVKHRDFNVYGLQFHPESILTPDGLTIIENFLEKVERGIL